MGYNSAIIVLNDRLHEIDKDPSAWWNKIKPVMSSGGHGMERSDVFHVEHMDVHGVYVIGGNTAVRLGFSQNPPIPADNDAGKVHILRDIAKQLGYNLVKLPARKPKQI